MKRSFATLFTYTLFFSILFISNPLNGQEFLKRQGKTIVTESGDEYILKGMGLGGWMIQEGYMLQTASFANPQHQIRKTIEDLIGVEDTDAFYDAWLANHCRKIDIDSLKSWGFNSVRLPMHYNLFTLPIEDEPLQGANTWLDKGFELTDSVISWCKQNDMYVVLDLHAAPGGQGYDQGISDYDPTKPSLWESDLNKAKTVALWKRIAERYVNEPTVGGYDLINEPNWDLPGGVALRELYEEITDSIRAVDTNHILFIEGNWFANDFTGLTPPWDENMVYSPHKYWSNNDQATMQWVLDMREAYDIPLYLGETGENSNVWFRDAIKLMEDLNIGWAWWPLKKVESIAGPVSVIKNDGYQALLDYWNGSGPQPSVEEAKAALMQLTENLKMENTHYQKDVIDAMFRQVSTDETIPFTEHTIPGVIHMADFDMGTVGNAYFDEQVATYHVSTGNYTAWNNGWSFRNDGVDIEKMTDETFDKPYAVGWTAAGEWMKYTVDIQEDGVYDVAFTIASLDGDGSFKLRSNGADLTHSISSVSTGDWQNYQNIKTSDVILNTDDNEITFWVEGSGFNIHSMEFIKTGNSQDLQTQYLSGVTLDENTIQLNINKPLQDPFQGNSTQFTVKVDDNELNVTGVSLGAENSRIIELSVDHEFKSSEVIKVSYNGSDIQATDGTALGGFFDKIVQNTIAIISSVPGRVEAEDFFYQEGIQLENTSDVGGGQNIGYLDNGDFLDYYINVAQTGNYEVSYRTASQSEMGQVQLQLVDGDNIQILHSATFPSTGDWQAWTTTSQEAPLEAGIHQIRILITQPLFNINWFEFDLLNSNEEIEFEEAFKVYPNPANQEIFIKMPNVSSGEANIQIFSVSGVKMLNKKINVNQERIVKVNVENLSQGMYYVVIIHGKDSFVSQPVLLLND